MKEEKIIILTEKEIKEIEECTGGGCTFCEYFEVCPVGQAMGSEIL